MSDTKLKYSVLMSVYHKENALYLKEAMLSMFCQTVSPDEFVLVCDGPLGQELWQVISQMQEKFGQRLRVISLEKNVGLGKALDIGLKHCRNELVARMDSDDISCPDRCERQLAVFSADLLTDIVSGTVSEFYGSTEIITGRRTVPQKHADIVKYSRKRSPFNHPAVMFKKTAVEAAGGYIEEYHLFEDYYLWIRMLKNGSVGFNLSEPVLLMRTPPDLYMRRGGWAYARDMLRFHRWMYRTGWSTVKDYMTGAIPHAMVCILPNGIRRNVYRMLHE